MLSDRTSRALEGVSGGYSGNARHWCFAKPVTPTFIVGHCQIIALLLNTANGEPDAAKTASPVRRGDNGKPSWDHVSYPTSPTPPRTAILPRDLTGGGFEALHYSHPGGPDINRPGLRPRPVHLPRADAPYPAAHSAAGRERPAGARALSEHGRQQHPLPGTHQQQPSPSWRHRQMRRRVIQL